MRMPCNCLSKTKRLTPRRSHRPNGSGGGCGRQDPGARWERPDIDKGTRGKALMVVDGEKLKALAESS
jgi:hypothetical protein